MGMVSPEYRRFDVYLVNLDPTIGHEIQKTRPCVIVSPDEMNAHIGTVIVAPLTTQGHPYPSRVPCHILDKDGFVVLDQLRTVDKQRLVKRLAQLSPEVQTAVLQTLAEMFAE